MIVNIIATINNTRNELIYIFLISFGKKLLKLLKNIFILNDKRRLNLLIRLILKIIGRSARRRKNSRNYRKRFLRDL